MKKDDPLVTRRIINLGVSALARELGLSAATISKKMKAGQTPDQIRRAAAQRQGRQPVKPDAPKRKGNSHGAGRPLKPSEYDLVIEGRVRMDALDDAKLRRARALAERGELENMLRRGELIPVAYVREWGSRFLTNARDTLLTGPGELADSLAAETDPLKAAAILRRWLEQVMNKFHQIDKLWAADTEEQVA